MSQRKELTKQGSKKLFTATAEKVHIKNAPDSRVMRGGIRL
jgi:hypothetical protein